MSDNWKKWEGQIVVGEFPLLRYLGGSERSAVFFTERHEGDRVVGAAIKLVPANPQAPQDEEVQLARWRMAAELSHPNLIRLYDMGRCEIAGVALLYVVMEYAEENLAQVLPGRALAQDEARAMLETVLDVMRHLHGQGFVHGRLGPANIVAVGDQLKISSDNLKRIGEPIDRSGSQDAYEPPENARGILPVPQTTAAAGDVWSLGVTLVETLTGSLPVAPKPEQQGWGVPQSLPQPFFDIASHCLIAAPQGRWTLAQIKDRLEGRIPATVAPPRPSPSAAASRIAARSAPPPARYRSAGYIAGGLALLLAAILAGPSLLRHHAADQEAPRVSADSGQAAQPEPNQAASSPRQDVSEASAPTVPGAEPIPKGAVPGRTPSQPLLPAAIRTPVGEKPAGGADIHGEVAQQVMPQVAPSARETIQGVVKVRVHVNVDPAGNVKDAEFDSPGPSKYFGRVAMQAAQNWKFKPPQTAGQATASSWILQFEFAQDGTKVVPTEKAP